MEVAAERVASINPSCVVRAHQCFFLPETAGQFDFAAFDYVVTAVDTVSAKIALVEAAFAARVPIVSSCLLYTSIVLALTLNLLGVSAPVKM